MAAALVAAAAAPAAGQAREAVTDVFRGSVPQGTASAEPLALSFKETLDRGLQFNLGLLLQEETQRAAHGARWTALADLLPNVRGSVSERRQVINLEAFGFPAPDPIVGPFNVFDARIGLSQRLIDLAALNEARAASLDEKVQLSGIRSARELVVLVTVNPYLEAVSASSRIDVARAQLETANVLQRQASNLKTSGLVAGIDVLRAEAQVQRQRQRLIVAENEFEKAKLRLGRADVAAALERARAIGRSDAHRIREQGIYRQAWNPNSARQAGRQSPGCLGSRGRHRVSGRAQAAGGGATAQERRRRCAARHPRRHAARAGLGEAAGCRIVAPRPHHRWHSRRGHGPARP
jgi:outer membrane protein TolC